MKSNSIHNVDLAETKSMVSKIPEVVIIYGVNDALTRKNVDLASMVSKSPEVVTIYGVNDALTRTGWYVIAFLCLYAFAKTMDHNYLSISAAFLYAITFWTSTFCEVTSPVYRAHRWVRMFVPFILFIIIYIAIMNFQTFQASVLILSTIFGPLVLVQLFYPIEGFSFGYVVIIIILGIVLAIHAYVFDPKTDPYWLILLHLFIFDMPIYFLNHRGEQPDQQFFSFY